MNTDAHIVIVTHNSVEQIRVCFDYLSKQTIGVSSAVIVDSGSEDTTYLDDLQPHFPLRIFKEKNIGFSKANNLGFNSLEGVGEESIVIFLNPDAFLRADFIESAGRIFSTFKHKTCVTGKLLSYNLLRAEPSNYIDSTGIYRKWYGRWYDRGQGQIDCGQYDGTEEPDALCGALLCFRFKDLATLKENIFDEDFYLYKEDIELSIRLKKSGWRLIYEPSLLAYHCRGWQMDRKKVGFVFKKISAKNEIMMYKKHPSPYICWALLKYIVVIGSRY